MTRHRCRHKPAIRRAHVRENRAEGLQPVSRFVGIEQQDYAVGQEALIGDRVDLPDGPLLDEAVLVQLAREALGQLGHKVEWWPEWTWMTGAVCTIVADQPTGVLKAGADPRRPSYAVGL